MAAFQLVERDSGFPGSLSTIVRLFFTIAFRHRLTRADHQVKYEAMNDAVFRIEMRASPTHNTPVMLSSHVYWTLGDDMKLQIESQRRVAVDDALVRRSCASYRVARSG